MLIDLDQSSPSRKRMSFFVNLFYMTRPTFCNIAIYGWALK